MKTVKWNFNDNHQPDQYEPMKTSMISYLYIISLEATWKHVTYLRSGEMSPTFQVLCFNDSLNNLSGSVVAIQLLCVWKLGGFIQAMAWLPIEFPICVPIFLVGGWAWPTPLKNDGVKVSWDDEIPNWMESQKIPWFQTTNQISFPICFPIFCCRFSASILHLPPQTRPARRWLQRNTAAVSGAASWPSHHGMASCMAQEC